MDLEIGKEVEVKSKQPRKRQNTTSKVLKELLICLYTNQHRHMLKWADIDKKRFEVRLVNKQSKKIWRKEDISLFEHLDSLFEKKVRSKFKYEENVKNRFKARMAKLLNYIKELKPSRKESKSVTYRIYEIFNMPIDVKMAIEKLRNKSFEDEVKSNEVPYMESSESSNLGAFVENQNYFRYEENGEIINIPNMESGESIVENQNNFRYEEKGEIINIPNMESAESILENQNNFRYKENGEIININIMGRNEDAMLGTFHDDLSNLVSTPASDFNTLNNGLQASQLNFNYISPNAYVGNFSFSKFEENVTNFKEKNEVVSRTLNKVSVTPFDTFVENSNIQNALTPGIFDDLNLYDLYSSDYEGNMEFGCTQIGDNFQLPVVENESQSFPDENSRILEMTFFNAEIQN